MSQKLHLRFAFLISKLNEQENAIWSFPEYNNWIQTKCTDVVIQI